jgi:hypothetical protein
MVWLYIWNAIFSPAHQCGMLGRTAAVCAHEAFVFNPPRLCPSSTGDLLQRTPDARCNPKYFRPWHESLRKDCC